MTVAELIKVLNDVQDKSQRVVVNGYEGGYTDVGLIEFTKVILNVHAEWYYGPHDKPDEVPDRKAANKAAVPVILIRG